MRIAFTVHKYPPASLGGTEIYTLGLARSLVRLGHAVHVFHPQPGLVAPEQTTGDDGVQLWRTPLPASRMTENAAAQFWHTFRDRTIESHFSHFLSQVQPDLIHFQHVQAVSARLIELARGMPRVATLHDYWYFCANSQLIRPDRQPCGGPSAGCRNCVDCATARADLHWLQALRPLVALPLAYRNHYLAAMAAQIDHFVAPSQFLRQQYIDQGFAADKISVLENGIDSQRLLSPAPFTVEQPTQRPRIGFLGALAWQKGVHVLVEAFNQLPADAASLAIYGSEQAFPDYAAQVRANLRHPQAQVFGSVPFDAVGAVLRTFDVLVVPSLWYENSPLVIQEAYALGVPVIASGLGALAEKVQDGVTGRLFNAGNVAALTEVLADIVRHPEQLAAYRANLPQPPSMDTHALAIERIYQTLLHATDL